MTPFDFNAFVYFLLGFLSVKYDSDVYGVHGFHFTHQSDSIKIPLEIELLCRMQKYVPEIFRNDNSFIAYNALQVVDNKIVFRKKGDKYWYIHADNDQQKAADSLREKGLIRHISYLCYDEFSTPVYMYENGSNTQICDYLPDYLIVEVSILIMEQMPIIAECTVLEDTVLDVRKFLDNLFTFEKYPYSIFLGLETKDIIAIWYYDEGNIMRFGAKNADILNKLATEHNVELVYSRGI